MILFVLLEGSSLLEGVGIVSTCLKVLNDFKADVFKIDPLIVITSVHFPTYQVLAFASTRNSTKFEYSFDFPSAFRYFNRLSLLMTWEVSRIVFDVGFDLAGVEGIGDKRKSTVR